MITANEIVCPDSEGFVSLEWENVRLTYLLRAVGPFLIDELGRRHRQEQAGTWQGWDLLDPEKLWTLRKTKDGRRELPRVRGNTLIQIHRRIRQTGTNYLMNQQCPFLHTILRMSHCLPSHKSRVFRTST